MFPFPTPVINPGLIWFYTQSTHQSCSSSTAHSIIHVEKSDSGVPYATCHTFSFQQYSSEVIRVKGDVMDLTVIIVTSPSKSNPAVTLIEKVIDSLDKISGLDEAPIMIVMDGYDIFEKARTKRGRITEAMAKNYDQYYFNLRQKYSPSRVSILRLEKHNGFALAVREGLLQCKTSFSLILQHDRAFYTEFNYLKEVCQTMLKSLNIRYVGFPTVMSKNQLTTLHCRYRLNPLVDSTSHIVVESGRVVLHPLIFWYDSNHLAHVERYLQIFHPYQNMSASLRDEIGLATIKKMLLKKGDFIEDRFGQTQRNLLAGLRGKDSLLLEVFQWYGCYMLWSDVASTMVVHLRGRHFDPIMECIRYSSYRKPSQEAYQELISHEESFDLSKDCQNMNKQEKITKYDNETNSSEFNLFDEVDVV